MSGDCSVKEIQSFSDRGSITSIYLREFHQVVIKHYLS